MARGSTEVATYLVDTKNSIVDAVNALNARVEDSARTLTGRIEAAEEALKADQRETRSRALSALGRTGEAVADVSSLRQEFSVVRQELDALRAVVLDLADQIRKAAETPPGGTRGDQAATATAAAPEERTPTERTPEDQKTVQQKTEEAGPVPLDPGPEDPAPDERTGTEPDAAADRELARALIREDPPAPGDEPSLHSDRGHTWHLLNAALVSRVVLTCHRDTWEFLSDLSESHPHFRAPAQITEAGDGRVAVELSGRSVIAALIALRHRWQTASASPDDLDAEADWSLASSLYGRIARSLRRLTGEGAPVTVVLDDRAPGTEQAAQEAPGPPAV